jgi:hypothetical protein
MALWRTDLVGGEILPMIIYMIDVRGFINLILGNKPMPKWDQMGLTIDNYSDNILHLLNPSHPWSCCIKFHRVTINMTPGSRISSRWKI